MIYYTPPVRPEELYHHGIKGMKWGVRRYQNADGTLTSAGRKRYARDLVREAAGKKRKTDYKPEQFLSNDQKKKLTDYNKKYDEAWNNWDREASNNNKDDYWNPTRKEAAAKRKLDKATTERDAYAKSLADSILKEYKDTSIQTFDGKNGYSASYYNAGRELYKKLQYKKF